MGAPPSCPVYEPQFAGPPIVSQGGGKFCPDPCPPAEPGAFDEGNCLPNDGAPNAFKDDTGCRACGIGVEAGIFGLLRQSPGSGILGFQNPQGAGPFALPAAGTPAALNLHDVDTEMHFGGRAGFTYQTEYFAFEVCGFYTSYNSESNTIYTPQTPLTLGFAYYPQPAGFGGIWNQVDLTKLSIQSAMGDVEANVWMKTTSWFEWCVGVRYLDYQETYGIFVDDTALTTGVADPTHSAQYSSEIHDRIVAPQLGFQCEKDLAYWVAVGASGKGAWGCNFLETQTTLERGDGLTVRNQNNVNQFGQVYEAALYADFAISQTFHIRAGYQCLWLVSVPQATSQIDFNLLNTGASVQSNSSIFFHGPMLDMRLEF
jgi:hypothetical protein